MQILKVYGKNILVFFLFDSLNKQGTTIIITSNLKNIIKLDYKTINLNNLSNDKL